MNGMACLSIAIYLNIPKVSVLVWTRFVWPIDKCSWTRNMEYYLGILVEKGNRMLWNVKNVEKIVSNQQCNVWSICLQDYRIYSPIFFIVIVCPLLILLLYLSEATAQATIKNISTYIVIQRIWVPYFTGFSPQCANLKVIFQNMATSQHWLPSSETSIQIVNKGFWPLVSSINWLSKNV